MKSVPKARVKRGRDIYIIASINAKKTYQKQMSKSKAKTNKGMQILESCTTLLYLS